VAEEQVEDKTMAASMSTNFPISLSTPVAISTPAATTGLARPHRLRRITPQAGHALEILGHAIEYLTDEFVHSGSGLSPASGPLDAVQLLMSVNRQIYYECPEVPTVMERLRSMLHLRAA
jgi:hypothetical protein